MALTKEEKLERVRKWKKDNKDKVKAYKKKYYKKQLELQKKWREKNREYIKKYRKDVLPLTQERIRNRKKINPSYKISETLICPRCYKTFVKNNHRQIYCSKPCMQSVVSARYRKSETYKVTRQKYIESDNYKKGKAARARANKKYFKKYMQTAHGKETHARAAKKYYQSKKVERSIKKLLIKGDKKGKKKNIIVFMKKIEKE